MTRITRQTFTEGKREDEMTIESISQAVLLIKQPYEQKLEMCRKHWKSLSKELENKSSANPEYLKFNVGALGGIPVIIKPYLKKIRLYRRIIQ